MSDVADFSARERDSTVDPRGESLSGDVLEVGIVGAGISGVCMGIRLRRAGIRRFAIFERLDGVGGVWRANRYPGAGCDVESHFYSFSFCMQDWTWSRKFARQGEILDYLETCAAREGVQPHIQCGTDIAVARWDNTGRHWALSARDGRRFRCRVLVIAVGIFGEPNVIALPGQEDFAGEVWHSSELSDTAVFEMKDVAVIGSGASAVQVVPELAECARSVHVFQREPAWVVPKDDRVYQPTMLRVFKMIPLARRFNRWRLMARHEIQAIRRPGGLRHRRLTSLATRHLQRSIADEEQRRVLQPSYPILCKRLLRTSAYYEALRRANVDLTDRPIERLGPRTIRTTDGVERPADVIVCATGFRPTEYLSSIKVIGPDGDDLTALWRTTGSITTYLGITVPRYPNLFMLYGPNTNSLTAVTYIVEQQTKYVERMVRRLLRSGADAVTVKPAVAEDFERLLSAGLEGSVWAGGCNSYYSNGNGRIVTQWPYSGLRYWWLTHRLRERDYLWA